MIQQTTGPLGVRAPGLNAAILRREQESLALKTPTRLHAIEAKAFKAFKNFSFTLDSKHLLAYGGNGAGKSSLFWSLFTALQSAGKPRVDKYFEVNGAENLLNIHCTPAEQCSAGLCLSLKTATSTVADKYTIDATQHDTKGNSVIQKAALASDFITYRVLSSFYQSRNSQVIDLWPVFEQEILPSVQVTSGRSVMTLWAQVKNDPFIESKVSHESSNERQKRYKKYNSDAALLNTCLDEVLAAITLKAQQFYNDHFAETGQKLVLKVGLTQRFSSYQRKAHTRELGKIGFEISLNGNPIRKPQSFLNEAKLSQLALSVRFGATLARFHDAPMKLLVLDDLLISLDMNNRIKVVDIILSDTFKEYQKIILTHDIGFFKEFRRRIGQRHVDWSFSRFVGTSATDVRLEIEQSDIEKAHTYVNLEKLDEAAICMRKAAEDMALRLRVVDDNQPIKEGEFQSLTKNLTIAKSKLRAQIPHQLCDRFIFEAKKEHFNQQAFDALKTLISLQEWLAFDCMIQINNVQQATERVLNPGSHAGDAPLYMAEVTETLVLLERFLEAGNALLTAPP